MHVSSEVGATSFSVYTSIFFAVENSQTETFSLRISKRLFGSESCDEEFCADPPHTTFDHKYGRELSDHSFG